MNAPLSASAFRAHADRVASILLRANSHAHTFHAEELPSDHIVLKLLVDPRLAKQAAFGLAHYGFRECGSTGANGATRHYLGTRFALSSTLLPFALNARAGQRYTKAIPAILGSGDTAYAYPTQFTNTYMALVHTIDSIEECLAAFSRYLVRARGVADIGLAHSFGNRSSVVPVTIDSEHFPLLLAYPMLHSVQGVHALRRSGGSL